MNIVTHSQVNTATLSQIKVADRMLRQVVLLFTAFNAAQAVIRGAGVARWFAAFSVTPVQGAVTGHRPLASPGIFWRVSAASR